MLRVGFSFIPVYRYPDFSSGALPFPRYFACGWRKGAKAPRPKIAVGRDFRVQDNAFADFLRNGTLAANAQPGHIIKHGIHSREFLPQKGRRKTQKAAKSHRFPDKIQSRPLCAAAANEHKMQGRISSLPKTEKPILEGLIRFALNALPVVEQDDRRLLSFGKPNDSDRVFLLKNLI